MDLQSYRLGSSSVSHSQEIPAHNLNLRFINESDLSFELIVHNLPNNYDDEVILFEGEDDFPSISESEKVYKNARKERQIRRNTGQSYEAKGGNIVSARSIKPLQKCKRNCRWHISYENQQQIFNEYWSAGKYEKRINFVTSCVTLQAKSLIPKKNNTKIKKFSVTYELSVHSNKIVVCKRCFLDTLGETESFVKNVVNKIWDKMTDTSSSDQKGRKLSKNQSPPEKIKEIENHIQEFPTYESHYSHRHTKKYLPAGLHVATMYKLYVEKTAAPLSLKIYRKVFATTHLQFKSTQLDTCHKCDEYEAKMKFATIYNIKDAVTLEKESHLRLAELAFEAKNQDKKLALNSNESCILYTFDLQQCLPCPVLDTSIAFYKRPLWVFNLTINSTSENTKCFMWHEAIAKRGANEIASCLYQHLLHLSPFVKHAIFYSDCCLGQNKNKIIVSMFTAFNGNNLEKIDYKFLVPGHTHMECDLDHAVIEKAKKKDGVQIHHPQDWYELVRNAKENNPFEVIEMTQKHFYDFEKLFSDFFTMPKQNEDTNQFLWRDVRWLRFQKGEQGIIYYKTSFLEEDPFSKLEIRKTEESTFILENRIVYDNNSPLPISKEKKKDLLDVLTILRPDTRNFYEQLIVDDNLKILDPDLEDIVCSDDKFNHREMHNEGINH